jgi:hypothetical protein
MSLGFQSRRRVNRNTKSMSKITIVVLPDVELPALDTRTPPRSYKFIEALREWALYGPVMRKEENLEHMEEIAAELDRVHSSNVEEMKLSEPAFQAAVASFGHSLDLAMDNKSLPIAYASPILRMFHKFSKSNAPAKS